MRRVVPAAFLLIEGISSAVWVAGLVAALSSYPVSVAVLVLLRLLVGVVQATGGWLLAAGRPPGAVLARGAFLASAVLTTLETGFRLVPTNADPTYRWVTVALYWIYATGMLLAVPRSDRDPRP